MDNQPYQPFQPYQPNPQPGVAGPDPSQANLAQPGATQQQMPGSWAASPSMTGGAPIATANIASVGGSKDSGGNKSLLLMILAIIGGLVSVTFIALFIWMYARWDSADKDVESKITAAVTEAVNNKAEEMENEFIEREKSPYRTFAGPADYGELSFEYPKTWSVYEAKDATNGGDYEAYLNPDKVYPVGVNTINALRVTIKDQAYDTYVATYENYIKSGKLAVSVRPINGENANLYTGEMPGNKIVGIAAVFKIRDKTAIIQTDAMLFEPDYQKILDSVRFNQ